MPTDDLTVIYSGNIVQADLLKSLLEGDGIPAMLEDEYLGKMVPYAASAGRVNNPAAVSGLFTLSTVVHTPANK